MPTILFDSSFKKAERIILSKTFRSNCRDLGITKCDATIATRKVPMGHPRTDENGNQEYCLGGINKLANDHFVMGINGDSYRLKRAIWCLGHEMVHFHQCIRGDMDDLKRRGGGTVWKGQFYPDFIALNPTFYHSLPWEREAHAKQEMLFHNAMRCLDPMEQTMVDDSWQWGDKIR